MTFWDYCMLSALFSIVLVNFMYIHQALAEIGRRVATLWTPMRGEDDGYGLIIVKCPRCGKAGHHVSPEHCHAFPCYACGCMVVTEGRMAVAIDAPEGESGL